MKTGKRDAVSSGTQLPQPKKEPLRTRSFYIEKETLKRLNADAELKGMSTNALANRVLHDYVEYQIYSEGYGYIIFARHALKDLLDKLEPEEIAGVGADFGRKFFLTWSGQRGCPVNCDTLKLVMQRLCYWGRWGTYMETLVNGKRVVSINHGFGLNFSLFLKAFVEAIIALFPEKDRICDEVKTFEHCVAFSH